VAIRAGTAPGQPDNGVQPFVQEAMGLYASQEYLARYGTPAGIDDCDGHRFVAHDSDESRAPFNRWLAERIPRAAVTFRSGDVRTLEKAILAGAGIGFMPVTEAEQHPSLTEVFPREEAWSAPLWLVTHVDLHRTAKVQAFLSFLKAAAKDWQG